MDSYEFLAYSEYDNETINLLLGEQSKKYIVSGMEIILKSIVLLMFWYWKNMLSINTFLILFFSIHVKNKLETMVNEIEQIKINLGICLPNDNKQKDSTEDEEDEITEEKLVKVNNIYEDYDKKTSDLKENINNSDESLSDILEPSTQKISNSNNSSEKLQKNYNTSCKKNRKRCVYKTSALDFLSDTESNSDLTTDSDDEFDVSNISSSK